MYHLRQLPPRLVRVLVVFIYIYIYSYIAVSSSYCIFLLFWEKNGFEAFECNRRKKLPPNTFPTFRALSTHTKTKRRKLVLKRRKMALKQRKFVGTTRIACFFSKRHGFFQTARIIALLKNDTFSAHQGGIGIFIY